MISSGRDGCNWQAALDVLAQVPTNTMQLDTMAGSAVVSVPVKTASTITGIVCEKAAYVSRHGPADRVRAMQIRAVEMVVTGIWLCLMAVMPRSTERQFDVACIAAITTNGMVENCR